MRRCLAFSTLWIVFLSLSAVVLQAQSSPSTAATVKPASPSGGSDATSPEEPMEDWTTISLEKSGLPLASIGGVTLSKAVLPDCTRELVRLQWRVGDPIDLYVIKPLNSVDKLPAILYLFDYTKDSDNFRGEAWCKQAKQTRIAVVGFVSALTGQRFHAPRPMKQWFVSELQEALATSTHDVQMILNYLGTRGDLDMKHIGMFGQGSGGSIAILAAAADPRISALEVLDPWADWPDWLKSSPLLTEAERSEYLKPEFLKKIAPLDPIFYLPQLRNRTIRIEEIEDYPVNPQKLREKIASLMTRPDGLVQYKDIMALQKEWSQNYPNSWLGSQIKPTS